MLDRVVTNAPMLNVSMHLASLDCLAVNNLAVNSPVVDKLAMHPVLRSRHPASMDDAPMRGAGVLAALRGRRCWLRSSLSLRDRNQRRTKQRNGAAP